MEEAKPMEGACRKSRERSKAANPRLEQIQQSYLNEKKFGAHFRRKQSNILPKPLSDLDMLDLSSLEIETTSTGKINVLVGAGKFAERLKSDGSLTGFKTNNLRR